jgi:hypothetical protein
METISKFDFNITELYEFSYLWIIILALLNFITILSQRKTKNEIKETLMVILKPLYCGMIITSHAVGL